MMRPPSLHPTRRAAPVEPLRCGERVLAALAWFLLLLAAPAVPALAAPSGGVYHLKKDGVTHEVSMVKRGGTDLLSLADLLRALGGTMTRTADAGIRVRIADGEFTLAPGAREAKIGGRTIGFSAPVADLVGRVYVPPDFVTTILAAALDRSVEWRGAPQEGGARDGLGARVEALAREAAIEPAAAAGAAIRADVQVRSQRDYTRVVIRCAKTDVLPYTVSTPTGKILLRIQGDNVSAEPMVEVGDGALERIGFEQRAGRGTFSFELGPDYRDHQTAVLRDPFRVVIDIARSRPYDGPSTPARAPRPAEAAPTGPPAAEPPVAAPAPVDVPVLAPAEPTPRSAEPGRVADAGAGLPPASGADLLQAPARPFPAAGAAGGSGRRVRTIVLDPGHGGSESGARGPSSLLEKDVNLAIAIKLKRALERKLGLRVVLTRTSDAYLSLDDRTGIANNEKADLFVSIHANASLRANARGAETYFLSSSATDDEWRTQLAQETGAVAEAEGLSGTDLELILWSLAQTQYHRESEALAEVIQAAMNESLGIRDRGVKQAPFKVLVGATMPAVLVEVGFITNPAEERLLRDDEYQDRLVEALFQSVVRFKREVGSSRVDLQACKLEYSIVSPK